MYAPFALGNGVRIIGGFAGTEALASQSNPSVNVTIVDGSQSAPCVTNINSVPSAPTAVLRGFTIRNARVGGSDEGGGMVLQNSNAFIVNCIFEGNSATYFGGAVTIRGTGSPQFINCIFRGNGTGEGTAVHPYGGGGVFVRDGTPLFVNCLFAANKAGEGGAVSVLEGLPTLINCTMVSNHATIGYGGAIFDRDGRVTLKNCILWDNQTATGVGYAEQIFTGPGGTSLATYCNIQGGWTTGSNIINVDPLFNNPAGNDYKLQSTSPCKNAGNTNDLPVDSADLDWDTNTVEPTPKDLARGVRTVGTSVDIGAYEVPPPPPKIPPAAEQ